jgi:hypothetical protein
MACDHPDSHHSTRATLQEKLPACRTRVTTVEVESARAFDDETSAFGVGMTRRADLSR